MRCVRAFRCKLLRELLLERRSRTGPIALPQLFYYGASEAELGLCQAKENFLEIHQACVGGIGQNTRCAGDSQSQRCRYAAAPFFINDKEAGRPVLPSECDSGSFARIKGLRFLKKRSDVRQDEEPRLRSDNKLP